MADTYAIFIFRRDLRIADNKGLQYALHNHKKVIPVFIFTPEQIGSSNKYRSENAIQFMAESLKDLDTELKNKGSRLHIFQGENEKVISNIICTIPVCEIIYNRDYTPYSISRDKKIQALGKKKNIKVTEVEDYLLRPMGDLLKKDGKPYTVFTPFFNHGKKFSIDKPKRTHTTNLTKTNKLKTSSLIQYTKNKNILAHGGRKQGLSRLKSIPKQSKYNTTRNMLEDFTTLLSPYIKFGCVSIREVFWACHKNLSSTNQLFAQLFWREFYYYIVYYFPRVLKGKCFNEKFDAVKWPWEKSYFDHWCNGTTGIPIVDAGMRELNATGYMHNRARLITSNFLNRLLGINWQKGEMYFAQQLTDYDPAVNNGNWQWIASCGTDPKPYFQRLFNPWLQSKKYDPDAAYIKKWIPELTDIPPKEIHQWNKYCKDYELKTLGYPAPIIDTAEARKKSVALYRSIK